MEAESKPEKLDSGINYYVIAAIFVASIFYTVGLALEPDIDSELDFFEAILTISFAAAAIFGFSVAKRYWGSKVFGRAYLALALGYASYFVGWALWFVYEIFYQVENPYPYYPDIFYFAYYPLAIYHIRTNIHYFRRKLNSKQNFVIFSIPVAVTLLYAFFGYVPLDVPNGIFSTTTLPIPEYDFDFHKEFWVGAAFVFATSLVFSYATIGAQVFRGTVLGPAWGLLLVGFALNTFGDIPYYYFELFGIFDRADPANGMWVAGTMIVCYALYKHRDL